jgi:hypothetical protein
LFYKIVELARRLVAARISQKQFDPSFFTVAPCVIAKGADRIIWISSVQVGLTSVSGPNKLRHVQIRWQGEGIIRIGEDFAFFRRETLDLRFSSSNRTCPYPPAFGMRPFPQEADVGEFTTVDRKHSPKGPSLRILASTTIGLIMCCDGSKRAATLRFSQMYVG